MDNGDLPDVIEQAYTSFAPSLYRYALLLLVDHAGAEDAVHQVFFKLARMGRRAGNIECVQAYLRSAVRNECYRILKQRKSTATVAPAILEPIAPHERDDEQRSTLEAGLKALPPQQREVIHLKIYEQMTFDKIAIALNISPNTAASRYRYAIDKLRKALCHE